MKVLLLAGEESGLLYAREVAERLRRADPSVEIRGYSDYGFATADLAVVGFGPVLRRLGFFLRVARTMRRVIDTWRPDVVFTVDYPGLNLRLAAYAKKRGIRAIHLVCPQVWAWKSGRIPKIERALDRLLCFFPFEPALFKAGFATFVGHPLATAITPAPVSARGANLVALLPGSRRGEIARNLPVLLAAGRLLAEKFPMVRFSVPAANAAARCQIEAMLKDDLSVTVTDGGARALFAQAACAAVASGTATLEAALAGCPTVLVYRVNPLFAWVARHVLIKGTRFLGLANIVWDRNGATGAQPMTELLQDDFTPEAVAAKLGDFLGNASVRDAAAVALESAVAPLRLAGDPLAVILRQLMAK